MARRTSRRSGAGNGPAGDFRIIGGQWRRRRLPVISRPGLRPTPDRVRETVFNWLAPVVSGARTLDLFAGTGALGLEALSRGAAGCIFVEADAAAVRQLRAALALLHCEGGNVVPADALAFLAGPPQAFDVVFVDPPYALDLLPRVCERLEHGWLTPSSRIYLEAPAAAGPPQLGPGWTLLRSARAGQVGYHLAHFAPPPPAQERRPQEQQ
jgi:16S rRNA (guanine966-N2)-methyltransferase